MYYGRDYPAGYDYFRQRLRKNFVKNSKITDQNEIERLIARGDFVIKEIEALYKLKKYRTLKRLYYDQPDENLTDITNKLENDANLKTKS